MTDHTETTHTTDADGRTENRDGRSTSDDAAGVAGRPVADGGVDAEAADERSTGETEELSWTTVRRYLLYAAIGGLATLAAWATFQVYLSTSRAISIWISPDFVPVFAAAFNVVVVLVSLAGIVAVLRRLS